MILEKIKWGCAHLLDQDGYLILTHKLYANHLVLCMLRIWEEGAFALHCIPCNLTGSALVAFGVPRFRAKGRWVSGPGKAFVSFAAAGGCAPFSLQGYTLAVYLLQHAYACMAPKKPKLGVTWQTWTSAESHCSPFSSATKVILSFLFVC